MIHGQVPLPVPCYDFVLLTEPTFVPQKRELRVFPARLT